MDVLIDTDYRAKALAHPEIDFITCSISTLFIRMSGFDRH